MSSGPEAVMEDFVVNRAMAKGFWVRKVKWQGRRGAPDRVFARKDRGTVYIEFKAPDETPDSHQIREHNKMRDAGMEVHVCDNVEDAMRILGLWP